MLGRPALFRSSPLSATERRQLFHAFLSMCEWVKVYYLWRPNLRDEADNHLMELAVAAGAKAIVTNNVRDFRGAELRFPQIEVLSPKNFLEDLQ